MYLLISDNISPGRDRGSPEVTSILILLAVVGFGDMLRTDI